MSRIIRSSLFSFPSARNIFRALLAGFIILAGWSSPAAAQTCSGIPDIECQALYALYDYTDGDNWTDNTNWLSSEPAGSWFGITLKEGHVERIILTSNNLNGTIPPELGNLAGLKYLYLDSNNLTGAIPSDLGSLPILYSLKLRENALTGPIPLELCSLPNLSFINLSRNNLTGAIPTALGNMPFLFELYLDANQLTGPVPPELGNLANLVYLYLYSNNLTGSIPPELGNLTNLRYLYLGSNQLTGTIPPELGNMSRLWVLGLSSNDLTGTIPPELGNLEDLFGLELSNNSLTGLIPLELGNLTQLHNLYLRNNNLLGDVPLFLADPPQNLDLGYNFLYASDPAVLAAMDAKHNGDFMATQGALSCNGISASECQSMYALYYATDGDNWGSITNWLSSEPVSSWYGISYGAGHVTAISLSQNSLDGFIPRELGNLTGLQSLDLQNNSLRGEIPAQLGSIAGLNNVSLRSNRFSGDLPAFMSTPPATLDMRWNCLDASDPAVLAAVEARHANAFMSTQTVPPENVTAATVESGGEDENRVQVSWDPISYTGDEGGYQVYFRQGTDGTWYPGGMTADKEISSLTVPNLEPGADYEFMVDTVTWAHADNGNDLQSPESETDSAVPGTLSRAFIPNWKQAPGYWTGVVALNFGDASFDLELKAMTANGTLQQLGHNPAETPVGAGLQKSLLGFEFFQGNPNNNNLSWIELSAEGTNRMGSIFLFGVSDTQMMDGAESQTAYSRKLYFTRPLDEGFFQGWGPEIQMCVVNPTDGEVTVRLKLTGSNGTAEEIVTIPSRGFISGDCDDLMGSGHGIINGYLEIEVTEGAGVIGFSRIEFPGVRTALGMNAVESTQARTLYSAQLAHGLNIVTNLRLVNTSGTSRQVTLTAVGDDGSSLADPVQVQVPAESIYSADIGTLFGLEGEGTISTGSLVVEADGSGIIGDIIFAEGDTLEYAMSLPLQERLFQEAVFNHISNLPTVFTGFAFYNPGDQAATLQIEAIGTNGLKVAEKTLVLGPGERIARTLTDPDIWPTFGQQSGGYIRIESSQPIAGQQLFGDRSLRYMAAIPPTTRLEPMFD